MASRKRACDACYKRKIECDTSEAWPACNWCHHQQTSCTFNRVRGRKKRLSSSISADTLASIKRASARSVLGHVAKDHASSEHGPTTASTSPSTSPIQPQPSYQVAQIHQCLGCQDGRADPSSQPYFRRLNTAVLGQIYFAGQNLGTLCSRNGFPHLTAQGKEWIFSRTGHRPCFHKVSSSSIREDGEADQTLRATHDSSSSSTALPEESVVELFLHRFMKSDISLVFPLVEPVLFRRTIKLSYCPHGARSTLERNSAKACVFSFLAIVGHFLPEPEAASRVDNDACAKEAQRLFATVHEDVSIIALQTAIMMFLHETQCGKLASMTMYHALACRLIVSLGGHAQVPKPPLCQEMTPEELEDRHIRVLFWLVYMFDKNIALRTGQSPIFNDDFCDLSLPDGYVESRFYWHADTRHRGESRQPWFPGDLRLTILKSKACTALYSVASLHKSDAELLRTIRELDEELERWRASVPTEFSPLLYVPRGVTLAPELSEARSTLHIELTLDYHYLMSVIHSASSRCRSTLMGSEKEQPFGVQSSLELSVQASRSTLIFLSAAGHRLAAAAFWAFLFYPMSAVMTLFFNILRNPLGEHALHDLELFRTASYVIRSMPSNRMAMSEMARLEQSNQFIMELSRLSRHAMAQSRPLPE